MNAAVKFYQFPKCEFSNPKNSLNSANEFIKAKDGFLEDLNGGHKAENNNKEAESANDPEKFLKFEKCKKLFRRFFIFIAKFAIIFFAMNAKILRVLSISSRRMSKI